MPHPSSTAIPFFILGIYLFTLDTIQSNGKSFICDRTGDIISEASKDKEEIIIAEIDIEENHLFRRNWGLFRDRRIDLYKELLTLDGEIKD